MTFVTVYTISPARNMILDPSKYIYLPILKGRELSTMEKNLRKLSWRQDELFLGHEIDSSVTTCICTSPQNFSGELQVSLKNLKNLKMCKQSLIVCI